MREVRINSLVFHENAVVADVSAGINEFWVSLGPGIGFAQFIRESSAQGLFLLHQVLPGHLPAPSPLVSVRGVLWSRQAALEADQAIASYRAEAGPKQGFWLQPDSSGCRHEA